MELCVNTKLSYRGAAVNVKIYTISESVCDEVSQIINDICMQWSISNDWRHGGCEITSDDPLEIRTCDDEIEVIVSPANLLARMSWDKAVSKARENCEGC